MEPRKKDEDYKKGWSEVISASAKTEMDTLKQRLIDRDLTIVQLETQMAQNHCDGYTQTQLSTLRSRCDYWQDKYNRLLEAHKRIQKVNQGLEDKLLKLVDRTESEKARLTSDSSNLTTALTTAAQAIHRLKQQNERYKNDLNLAIQLLQCNSSQYGSHKLQALPVELQQQVKTKLQNEVPKNTPKTEMKVIKVPIPTFPPTAMVYSVNKYEDKEVEEAKPVDVVSAAIMAAVLEERQKERTTRHCPTCTCGSSSQAHPPHQDHEGGTHYSRSHTSDRLDNSSTLNKSGKKSGLRVIDVGTQTIPSYIGQSGCPWDWSLDSQDSGSPSTPTSLTSASLSYESEASSFASPQDSPGRISYTTFNMPQKPQSNNKPDDTLTEDARASHNHGDERLKEATIVSIQTV